MPGMVGGFGNFFVPVMLGAPDMANKLKIFNLEMIKKSFSLLVTSRVNITKNDFKLGYYLAGLFEGDGYITINNKNKLIFAITYNIKDEPLAKMILNIIGIGHICKRKTNSIELRFTNKTSLCKIVSLMNGKLRTPKVHDFNLLID
jgi:LAGLIDADG endonuclease